MSGRRSEKAVIEALLRRVPHVAAPAGPGDDAAVLALTPRARVLTTDALVEGTHFLRRHPPDWLGYKSLAVNLSDVAAMGATPSAFVISVALPDTLDGAYWDAFCEGLGECARENGVVCAGGDTLRSPHGLMITITAWGELPVDRALSRRGGSAGDALMVCGHVGRSAAGLRRWLADPDVSLDDPCVRAHLRPEPPLMAGPWALRQGARAGMDLSDGLAVDLERLAQASEVRLMVDLDRLPHDPQAPASPSARALGGEDYALVVLVDPADVSRFERRGFHTIGTAGESVPGSGEGVIWRLNGQPTSLDGEPFTHFDGG